MEQQTENDPEEIDIEVAEHGATPKGKLFPSICPACLLSGMSRLYYYDAKGYLNVAHCKECKFRHVH